MYKKNITGDQGARRQGRIAPYAEPSFLVEKFDFSAKLSAIYLVVYAFICLCFHLCFISASSMSCNSNGFDGFLLLYASVLVMGVFHHYVFIDLLYGGREGSFENRNKKNENK